MSNKIMTRVQDIDSKVDAVLAMYDKCASETQSQQDKEFTYDEFVKYLVANRDKYIGYPTAFTGIQNALDDFYESKSG